MGTASQMKLFKFKYLLMVLILFNILLASRWIIDGNLFFHTDIARDFLLMEDIVDRRHLTLIGPRSGAIPGLFHGPLWLYLNLPSYLIGDGDPVYVGWFWVLLYISSIFIIYFVGKKLFGKEDGFICALLLSSVTILNVRSLFNPYGALLLSPLFLYFFHSYLQNHKIKTLTFSFLILGFIIQFQMAFGVPILFLTFIYLIYYLFKTKKLSHLISLFILLIPLSTFLLFDLRNHFILFNSVTNYLWGPESFGKLNLSLFQLVLMRIKESVIDGLGMITQNNFYLTIFLLITFIFGIYKSYRGKGRSRDFSIYALGIFFYLGFWFFTIFFKGAVWNYYYLPFIPIIILLFVSLKKRVNPIIFYGVFSLIYLINVTTGFKDVLFYTQDPLKQDVSTWKFNKIVAEKVFSGSESEFGYFIFTPDLYGYSPRYALDFYRRRDKQKVVKPYEKQGVTYLVIAPPPEYGKDPNSIWYQKNINSVVWKKNDIRINKEPKNVTNYGNGFKIEKYELTDEETKIEPNPYLINGIFFR